MEVDDLWYTGFTAVNDTMIYMPMGFTLKGLKIRIKVVKSGLVRPTIEL